MAAARQPIRPFFLPLVRRRPSLLLFMYLKPEMNRVFDCFRRPRFFLYFFQAEQGCFFFSLLNIDGPDGSASYKMAVVKSWRKQLSQIE